MSGKSDSSDNDNFEDDDSDSDFNVADYAANNDSNDSSRDDDNDAKNHEERLKNQSFEDNFDGSTEAGERVGPRLRDGHRFDKRFICITYPGDVVDPEKAIETLGGLKEISTAIDATNRRLELRFRPDDGYCKPACGDRHRTHGFLLRVKVRRRAAEGSRTTSEIVDAIPLGPSIDPDPAPESDRDQPPSESTDRSTSTGADRLPFDATKYQDLSRDPDYRLPQLKVLGQVDTEFKFLNLCDFQFLPMTPSLKNPRANECIYDWLYPTNVPPHRWLKNKVPYFLPPAAFSRVDSVQSYVPKTETDSLPKNIIGKTRKRRAGFSNFINFNTPEVPTKAPKGIETAMKVKFLQGFHLERVRKFFEQRLIWSKNALMYETKFSSDQLKILLPSVAYYFMTGPWRIMWVKLGYDPRKDPSARKYQTLDYRLKAMHGLESTVKCKRNYSNYMLPYKITASSKPKTTVLSVNSPGMSTKKEKHLHENVYIYRDGTVPPSRQMFYQYCDILTDEVQEMLAKLPEPPPGSKCQKKMGWLPFGFDDQCREIINKQVRAVLRKQMNIPEDYPTKLPDKRRSGMNKKKGQTSDNVDAEFSGSHLVSGDPSSIHMEVMADDSDDEWEEYDEIDLPGGSGR